MERGLNNNQLKLIAMLTMTVDHVGLLLLPQYTVLRLIGRLAFPVYAFMIAEGCRHTRSMGRYLGSLGVLAAVCQVAYFLSSGSLYQCVMVTFSLSVGLIWLLDTARKKQSLPWWLLAAFCTGGVFFVTQLLPALLPGTDFAVEYDFCGVMLPVVIWFGRKRRQQLLAAAAVLALLCVGSWPGQWFCLLAIPLLALYNGHRGTAALKWLFYLYYPLHLVALQGLALLL